MSNVNLTKEMKTEVQMLKEQNLSLITFLAAIVIQNGNVVKIPDSHLLHAQKGKLSIKRVPNGAHVLMYEEDKIIKP